VTVTLPPTEARYFDAERETMPRDRLAELQWELLTETLAFAYDRVPLVRSLWEGAGCRPRDLGGIADFVVRAPTFDKDALRAWRAGRGDPFGGVCGLPVPELTAVTSTSGTTGEPTLVPERWGQGSVGPPAVMYRDLWEVGVRPGDHVSLFLFTFRGPVFAFVQQLGAVPVCFDHDPGEIERLLRCSAELAPTALYNFGGPMLRATAEVAAARGLDPEAMLGSYRGVVAAGEPLGPRARRLADGWGLEIFEHSSVGDVTGCFECREHAGMHVWEDTVLVEGFDPDTGRPCDPAAEHLERVELVATALVNRVAPLVRFRSGDLVDLDRRPCACGRTHARVRTLGRLGDEVVVDGRSVLPGELWEPIETIEACRLGCFQVIRPRRELDALRLRVGYRDTPPGRLAALRDEVAGAVAAAVGLVPEVELVPDTQLLRLGPPHKIPRVVPA
jgi:phenylacetate-CoA ligase